MPDTAPEPRHNFPEEQPDGRPFIEEVVIHQALWKVGPLAFGPRRAIALEVRVHRDARIEVIRLDGQLIGDLREKHKAVLDPVINRLLTSMRTERTGRIARGQSQNQSQRPVTGRTPKRFVTPLPGGAPTSQDLARREAELAEQMAFAERMKARRQEVASTRSFRRQDPSPDQDGSNP
jgi:hypothetical protein